MQTITKPATSLKVGYAYPSSILAGSFGAHKDGCWYFTLCDADGREIGCDWNGEPCGPFESKEKAADWAKISYPDLPFDRYCMTRF